MHYIDQKYFTDLQKWVVQKKLNGSSYDSISQLYKIEKNQDESLSHDAIKTCLKRSSLSIEWDKGTACGRLPIISNVDIDSLKEYIKENYSECQYFDAEDVLEQIILLRQKRFKLANNFLFDIKCYSIISELKNEYDNVQAEKGWLYMNKDKLEAELLTPKNVEINRMIACTPQNILDFTEIFIPIVDNYHPILRFCADETMLYPDVVQKILVPKDEERPIISDYPTLPHITGMCCCNPFGDKMPLFIILSQLKKLPNELKPFLESGKAYFSSSDSGWQTRDTFLWFAICFIHWLSIFKLTIDKSLRDLPSILIMDGHKSRECPLALQLFKQNNIDVFILPSHTTHLTQLFDVGIGSQMKRCFSQILKKLMIDFNPEENNAAQFREFIIKAALFSWDMKANMMSCEKAAKMTSTFPCNPDILLQNPFVAELTPLLQKISDEKEKKRRKEEVNINVKKITDDDMLYYIDCYVSKSRKHKHLCLNNYCDNYVEFVKSLCKRNINDCYYLSSIPSFYDNTKKQLIDFDNDENDQDQNLDN